MALTMAEGLLVSAVAQPEAAKSTMQASGSRVGRVADAADAAARLRSERYRQVRVPETGYVDAGRSRVGDPRIGQRRCVDGCTTMLGMQCTHYNAGAE